MTGDGQRSPGLVPAMIAALALRASGLVRRRAGADEPPPEPEGPGHETRDVNVRNTVFVMAGLVLSAVTVIGGMVLFMRVTEKSQREALPTLTPQQTARLVPPPPNLQANPYADLDRQRASSRAAIGGYGYLDPGHTRARIPIDRAMDLAVGRSLDGGGSPR